MAVPQPVTDYVFTPNALLVLGVEFAVALAFGLGANDAANAIGVVVGAGAISLRTAVILSGLMEFLGTVLLGGGVSSTIRKGVVDTDLFEGDDAFWLFMAGMTATIIGVTIWLLLATWFKLPVSTTHSTVGGVCGFAIYLLGWNSLKWSKIGQMAASWVISPVMGGLISATLQKTMHWTWQRSDTPLAKVKKYMPLFTGLTFFVFSFFIIFKGLPSSWDIPVWVTLTATVVATVAGSVIYHFVVVKPWSRRYATQLSEEARNAFLKQKEQVSEGEQELTAPVDGSDGAASPDDVHVQVVEAQEESADNSPMIDLNPPAIARFDPFATQLFDSASPPEFNLTAAVHGDYDDTDPLISSGESDAEIDDINIKKQKKKSFIDHPEEAIFVPLLVCTALALALAHGSNDAANAAGPLSAVFSCWEEAAILSSSETPFWVMLMVGTFIVVGLATLGYRVIETIGSGIAKVEPCNGFIVQLAASTTVLIAGVFLGLPLSTTHTMVGSIVGVALADKRKVDKKQIINIGVSWLVTLPVAGLTTALFLFFFKLGM